MRFINKVIIGRIKEKLSKKGRKAQRPPAEGVADDQRCDAVRSLRRPNLEMTLNTSPRP